MLPQTSDHARHGRHSFEHNRAVAIPFGKKLIGKKPQHFYKAKRNFIADRFRGDMRLNFTKSVLTVRGGIVEDFLISVICSS